MPQKQIRETPTPFQLAELDLCHTMNPMDNHQIHQEHLLTCHLKAVQHGISIVNAGNIWTKEQLAHHVNQPINTLNWTLISRCIPNKEHVNPFSG